MVATPHQLLFDCGQPASATASEMSRLYGWFGSTVGVGAVVAVAATVAVAEGVSVGAMVGVLVVVAVSAGAVVGVLVGTAGDCAAAETPGTLSSALESAPSRSANASARVTARAELDAPNAGRACCHCSFKAQLFLMISSRDVNAPVARRVARCPVGAGSVLMVHGGERHH